MTAPLSPIEQTIQALREREDALKKALDAEATAKATYKKKWATEMLQANGSVEAKKAAADIACNEEYLARLQAEAAATYTKQAVEDARAVLSARQTLQSISNKVNQATSYSHA